MGDRSPEERKRAAEERAARRAARRRGEQYVPPPRHPDPEPESEPAKLQIVDGAFTGPDYLVDIRIAVDDKARAGGDVV